MQRVGSSTSSLAVYLVLLGVLLFLVLAVMRLLRDFLTVSFLGW